MPAANEERADETTSTEEETKAEAERLDKLLRQIAAEQKLCADFHGAQARQMAPAPQALQSPGARREQGGRPPALQPYSRPCSPRSTTTASPHGHSADRDGRFFQVFMLAEEEHAETFRAPFDGERMHPSEKGKGARWAQWKKETIEQMPKRPP